MFGRRGGYWKSADAVEAAAQVRWQASLDLAVAQVDLHPERSVEAVPQRLAAGLRTCGERRHLCLVSVLPGTGVRNCAAIPAQTAPEHECRKRCEHAVHRRDRIPQLQLVAEYVVGQQRDHGRGDPIRSW